MKFLKKNPLVKTALLAILMMSSTLLTANSSFPIVNLKKGLDKSFLISMDYHLEKDFEITLTDDSYNTLFKEEIKQVKKLAKRFDLSSLPDGTYFFKVEDEQSIYQQTIEIKNDQLIVNKSRESRVFKPILQDKGNKVYINALLIDETDVEVKIYDKNHDLVLEETLKNQTSLERIYKFSDNTPGNYTFLIKYQGHSFTL